MIKSATVPHISDDTHHIICTPAGGPGGLLSKTGSWRFLRPVYRNRPSPCVDACPAGENIQGYLDLVKQGRIAEAASLIMEVNPLPAVSGRVCYHPCELACNRAQFDEPLAINAIERFLGDQVPDRLALPEPHSRRPEKVAIIGSGPAGLSCAYQLARIGFSPTIFEATADPGGMLRQGIPAYRLPRQILEREIQRIEALGVEFRTGVRLGQDLGWEDLSPYRAVFVAAGCQKAVGLDLPGENLPGIYRGLDFLRRVNTGQDLNIGRSVLVIGGGNVAVDAARSALRMGATDVTILYRRSEEEMPATRQEIHEATEEGIRLGFLSTPVGVLSEEGRLSGLRLVRNELGEVDASGRRSVIPIAGSTYELAADAVIAAVGQHTDLSFLPSSLRDELVTSMTGSGWIEKQGQVITVGGDALTGPARVVDAIGAGKRAAAIITARLEAQVLPLEERGQPVSFSELNGYYFEPKPRAARSRFAAIERATTFSEVDLGIESSAVPAEASRCFSCGVCNQCGNCWFFCPDMAVRQTDGLLEIDYAYCKGCGICAEECPRRAIALEEETLWRE